MSDDKRESTQQGSQIMERFVDKWRFEDGSDIGEIEIAFGLGNPKSVEIILILCNSWVNQNAESKLFHAGE
jgi:hypothetical protein